MALLHRDNDHDNGVEPHGFCFRAAYLESCVRCRDVLGAVHNGGPWSSHQDPTSFSSSSSCSSCSSSSCSSSCSSSLIITSLLWCFGPAPCHTLMLCTRSSAVAVERHCCVQNQVLSFLSLGLTHKNTHTCTR